jgi:hypothetical protein
MSPLEEICEPGALCLPSAAYEQVQGRHGPRRFPDWEWYSRTDGARLHRPPLVTCGQRLASVICDRIGTVRESVDMTFLTTQPLWLGVLLVGAATLLAMAGPILVRRRLSLDQLKLNNEVAGFMFATVGVFYAVLLAFAVIIAWERFSKAEDTAAQEAGAAATLYRLADGIGGDPGAALRDSLTRYVRAVITDEWPAMERSEASSAVKRALDTIYTTLPTPTSGDSRGTALLAEALHQLDVVTQARRTRLLLGHRRRSRGAVVRALRRRRRDDRLHAVLRHRGPAPPGDNDGYPVLPDLLGAAHSDWHEPSLRRSGEGGARGPLRGAGGNPVSPRSALKCPVAA